VATRQEQFERLAMPHTASLLRVAHRLTRDAHAAEDVVQEAMLSAWRGFHQFREGSNVRAWLFRILINAVNARGRKLRSMPPIEPIESHDRPVGSPAMALEISQAFDQLAVEQREVLLLAVVEGFTCEETAGILEIPIGTVMSRLSRGRHTLREQLTSRSVGKEA
jgi:RNA polymerase sigma-70 factor (ECF subfamily)